MVGGPVGAGAGLALALGGPRVLGRLESAAARQERERLLRDLPLVLDLLAACLAGGASLPAAADAVAGAVADRPAPVSPPWRLRWPSAHRPGRPGPRWPAPPDRPRTIRSLRRRGRSCRAAEGGAPVAAAVARLAAEARADARGRAEQAARRVGVLAVAPLGLCFLPAFVLLGVVPVVVGLAGPLLAGL